MKQQSKKPRSQHLLIDGFGTQHYSAGGHTLWSDDYYSSHSSYFQGHGDEKKEDWHLRQQWADRFKHSRHRHHTIAR